MNLTGTVEEAKASYIIATLGRVLLKITKKAAMQAIAIKIDKELDSERINLTLKTSIIIWSRSLKKTWQHRAIAKAVMESLDIRPAIHEAIRGGTDGSKISLYGHWL